MAEDTFTLKCRVLLEAAESEVAKVGKQVESTLARAARAAGNVWAGLTGGDSAKAGKGMGDIGGMLIGGFTKMVVPLLAIESLMRNSGLLLAGMKGILALIGMILRPIGDVIGGVVLTLFRIFLPFIRMLTVAWQPHQRAMLEALRAAQAQGGGAAAVAVSVGVAATTAMSNFIEQLLVGAASALLKGLVVVVDYFVQPWTWLMDLMTGGIYKFSERWGEATKSTNALIDGVVTKINTALVDTISGSFTKVKTDAVDPFVKSVDDLGVASIYAASDDGLPQVGGQLAVIGAYGPQAANALTAVGNAIMDFMQRLGSAPVPSGAGAGGGGGAGAAAAAAGAWVTDPFYRSPEFASYVSRLTSSIPVKR